MNIHTHMIETLKKDKVTHYKEIVSKLHSMLKDIDDLMEDPLFIDNIHGEQELSLDQTVDLLNGICVNFIPKNEPPIVSPTHEAGTIDVS